MNNLTFLAEGGNSSWVMWVILAVAFVLMIAMTIIPRRKQQKQTENMMSNLKVGDKVMTIGRIVGTIIEVDNRNNTVTIQSGEGEHASILVIDKLAVGMVINPNTPANKPVEKKEEKKEEEIVVEKTAKENKVADILKKHKKDGQATDVEVGTTEVVDVEKTAEVVDTAEVAETVDAEPVENAEPVETEIKE